MKISRLRRYALAVSAAFFFAGCGGSQPPIGEPGTIQRTSLVLPMHSASRNSGSTYKVVKGLLFVALADPERPYDDVQIYDVRQAHPKPIVSITDGVDQPVAVCIDRKRTVYVVNEGNNSISEYMLGSTVPFKVITSGLDYPGFCALDSLDNLWVTNISGVNVTEYSQGSSAPNEVITKGLTSPIGIAFDHAGNLYVSNHQDSVANVQVYHRGHTSPYRTITDGVRWPGGIGVDAAGTLYVTNLIPGDLEEYRSGKSKPYHTITQEMNGPYAVTFSRSGWMYVSNFGAESGGSGPAKTILEFQPGSQIPSKRMITQGLYLPDGTAIYPPAAP